MTSIVQQKSKCSGWNAIKSLVMPLAVQEYTHKMCNALGPFPSFVIDHPKSEDPFRIKTIFFNGYRNPHYKGKRSWNVLIFAMSIPKLVRRHFMMKRSRVSDN